MSFCSSKFCPRTSYHQQSRYLFNTTFGSFLRVPVLFTCLQYSASCVCRCLPGSYFPLQLRKLRNKWPLSNAGSQPGYRCQRRCQMHCRSSSEPDGSGSVDEKWGTPYASPDDVGYKKEVRINPLLFPFPPLPTSFACCRCPSFGAVASVVLNMFPTATQSSLRKLALSKLKESS